MIGAAIGALVATAIEQTRGSGDPRTRIDRRGYLTTAANRVRHPAHALQLPRPTKPHQGDNLAEPEDNISMLDAIDPGAPFLRLAVYKMLPLGDLDGEFRLSRLGHTDKLIVDKYRDVARLTFALGRELDGNFHPGRFRRVDREVTSCHFLGSYIGI
jgi:hypothetical protein